MVGLTAAACGYSAPRQPAQRRPPNVFVVGLDQVALRASAWVELHAWLAASGRASQPIPDAELDGAARRYEKVLTADDADESFANTTHALAACNDETCARAAVTGSPFAEPYLAALPPFLAQHWVERAQAARAGIDVARAALGPEVEALISRLTSDLAIEWPPISPVVNMVADAPEPGGGAPIAVTLGARGSCFRAARDTPTNVQDARVIDCVLVYTMIGLRERSAIARALPVAGAQRAWTALVVHAVAATVSAWEPRHASVLRRSAMAVMPRTMDWLASEWPSRTRGEPAALFAKHYAAALEEAKRSERNERSGSEEAR